VAKRNRKNPGNHARRTPKKSAPVPSLPLWRRACARFSGYFDVPKGWLIQILKSRLAPWTPRFLVFITVLYAAAPDFGAPIEMDWWKTLLILALLYVLSELAGPSFTALN
jgi:hypothetical protein